MALFQEGNDNAVLAGGRHPTPETLDYDALADGESMPVPSGAADGVALTIIPFGVIVALVSIGVREEPHTRTARITIPNLVIGEDYVVTIDGTAVTYDSTGDADLAEVLAGIAAAINANGTVNVIVAAQVQNASGQTTGTLTQIRIQGIEAYAGADYTIEVSATGAAEIECIADAVSCTAEIYGQQTAVLLSPSNVLRWRLLLGADEIAVDSRGMLQRADVGGLLRLYPRILEVVGVTGDGAEILYAPQIVVAPCGLEAP